MDTDLQEQKLIRMTTQPVKKLVCKMAVPSIVSMLISAIYNLADTFFIGQIQGDGTAAIGAIGVVFSYMALIQAISFFFGQGSGNFISRALGRRERQQASQMAAAGFFSAFFLGCALLLAGILWMNPILNLLGATPTILPHARKYFLYILLATPFLMSSMVLNNQMRFQGNARLGMIGISIGAVLNILLDPLMIFAFKMGVSGASLSTAISQVISFTVLLFLTRKGDSVAIRFKNFKPNWNTYKEITAGGMPSLCRQGLASIATVFLNKSAGTFGGDSAIAAFSVVSRITMFAASALIGFGQGFQPVCGFNFGAKKFDRVKEAYGFCVAVGTIGMTLVGVALYAGAYPLVGAFRGDDPALTQIAVTALRYQCFAMPLLGLVIMTNMFLQNIRKPVQASVLAMSRQGLAFVPVLLIAGALLGLQGVELSQPIADVISFAIALPLSVQAVRKLGK